MIPQASTGWQVIAVWVAVAVIVVTASHFISLTPLPPGAAMVASFLFGLIVGVLAQFACVDYIWDRWFR